MEVALQVSTKVPDFEFSDCHEEDDRESQVPLADSDPYNPNFDPEVPDVFQTDDPAEEAYFEALFGIPYTAVRRRRRTWELHEVFRARMADQVMSSVGEVVKQEVLRCGKSRNKYGQMFRCEYPVCPTCGTRQRDRITEQLIPTVKAWQLKFGLDRVSFISVDGPICDPVDVVKVMNRFRRALQNTYQNNLIGTEIIGEYELAPTDKPVSTGRTKQKRFVDPIRVWTSMGYQWVEKSDLNRDQDGDWFRDQDGDQVRVLPIPSTETVSETMSERMKRIRERIKVSRFSSKEGLTKSGNDGVARSLLSESVHFLSEAVPNGRRKPRNCGEAAGLPLPRCSSGAAIL